jgi:hypothetical protein
MMDLILNEEKLMNVSERELEINEKILAGKIIHLEDPNVNQDQDLDQDLHLSRRDDSSIPVYSYTRERKVDKSKGKEKESVVPNRDELFYG